jgi:predicted transcriptional regulator
MKVLSVHPDVYGRMREMGLKCPSATSVLLFLLSEMNKNNVFVGSNAMLHEALGFNRNTITKSINLLKEYTFIDVSKNGRSNIYTANASWFHISYQKHS